MIQLCDVPFYSPRIVIGLRFRPLADPELICHHEHPPLPPRAPTPRAAAMMRNECFLKELNFTVREDGLVGDMARTAAIKACYGSSSPRRPPSAPRQILAGKPPAAAVPEINGPCNPPMPPPPPTASSSYTTGHGGVHSRRVKPANAALKRSQSYDFVRANRENVTATPRTQAAQSRQQRDHELEMQRMRRGLPPSSAAWKLSKFKAVESKLHKDQKPVEVS